MKPILVIGQVAVKSVFAFLLLASWAFAKPQNCPDLAGEFLCVENGKPSRLQLGYSKDKSTHYFIDEPFDYIADGKLHDIDWGFMKANYRIECSKKNGLKLVAQGDILGEKGELVALEYDIQSYKIKERSLGGYYDAKVGVKKDQTAVGFKKVLIYAYDYKTTYKDGRTERLANELECEQIASTSR